MSWLVRGGRGAPRRRARSRRHARHAHDASSSWASPSSVSPVPWAWLALGARPAEQGLATDQDNAFAVECDEASFAEVDRYFAKLTTFVNERIEPGRIPRCRAGVVASNPEWRGTLHAWEERFWTWIREPARTGRAFVGIAFDLRRVAGPLDVEPALFEAIRSRPGGPVRPPARELAVAMHPPVGLLKDAIADPTGSVAALDVKEAGISPSRAWPACSRWRRGSRDGTLRRLRVAGIETCCPKMPTPGCRRPSTPLANPRRGASTRRRTRGARRRGPSRVVGSVDAAGAPRRVPDDRRSSGPARRGVASAGDTGPTKVPSAMRRILAISPDTRRSTSS